MNESAQQAPGLSVPLAEASTLREHHRLLIEQTLAAHGGNVTQAARQLRVSRGTLYRQLRQA